MVMKVYAKTQSTMSLNRYKEQLLYIRDQFGRHRHCCNVAPFAKVLETEKGGFLFRQHLHGNLYDRINSRPFLTLLEKKWIAYQLLQALQQCHSCSVCHGDIKTENVLLTSSEWVMLSDFACFKPTFLPMDSPADFSFYFDTPGKNKNTGRRRCYVAPERFVEETASAGFTVDSPAAGDSSSKKKRAAAQPQVEAVVGFDSLTPAMDVFSMGCVIAELFLEGKAAFDYSGLLAYKASGAGSKEVEDMLAAIPDDGIRDLVRCMIDLDPTKRGTAAFHLSEWCPRVFPARPALPRSWVVFKSPSQTPTRHCAC